MHAGSCISQYMIERIDEEQWVANAFDMHMHMFGQISETSKSATPKINKKPHFFTNISRILQDPMYKTTMSCFVRFCALNTQAHRRWPNYGGEWSFLRKNQVSDYCLYIYIYIYIYMCFFISTQFFSNLFCIEFAIGFAVMMGMACIAFPLVLLLICHRMRCDDGQHFH